MMNRRKFIKNTARGAAVFSIVPGSVLSGTGKMAPSDKIQVGFIGTGKQMQGLMKNIIKCEGVVGIAASDVFRQKLDYFKKAVYQENKNHGYDKAPEGYHYYRELLGRDDIDAVVIATPDHWHAQIAVDAAKAGKDIYCEKPMALTVAEGRAMVNATRKYDRIFQTGSMQRSWNDFRQAVNLIRNGYIGAIREVNVSVGEPVKQCDLPAQEIPAGLDWNEWIGPSLYRPYHEDLAPVSIDGPWAWWRGYRDFGGGLVTDWGAHMFDIVQWALDMDRSGPIKFLPPEDPTAEHGLTMVYENGVRVHHKLWGGEEDGNAIQFIGTDGRIEVSRRYLRTFPNEKWATQKLRPEDKQVYYSDNHYQNWIDGIRNRTLPVSDVEIGQRSATVCNVTNIAYELGRPLLWNPQKEEFVGDDYANKMISRPYRGKWDFRQF